MAQQSTLKRLWSLLVGVVLTASAGLATEASDQPRCEYRGPSETLGGAGWHWSYTVGTKLTGRSATAPPGRLRARGAWGARRGPPSSNSLAHRRPGRQGHPALLGHPRDLLRQREPHVLLDHVDFPHRDALPAQGLYRLRHENLGGRGAGGDADPAGPLEPFRTDVAHVVDQVGARAGRLRDFHEPDRVGAVGRPDHQQKVDVVRESLDGGLAVLGRIADVVARRADDLRKFPAQRLDHVARVVHGARGLGQIGDLVGVRDLEGRDLVHVGDHEDAIGALTWRADDLVVVFVTDEHDRVVFARVADRLEMHLGHQRAGGVVHAQAAALALLPHLR